VVPFMLGKALYEAALQSRSKDWPEASFVEFDHGLSSYTKLEANEWIPVDHECNVAAVERGAQPAHPKVHGA